jgi:hypothetical protein
MFDVRESTREPLVAPDLARDLGETALRVVDVPLHLHRRDRSFGERAVVEALRVAGVLPRLVREPGVDHPAVLDEAVPVAIAVAVDPLEREECRLAQALRERRVVGPPPGLREQHEEEGRRVDRAVVAREPELGAATLADLVHDLAGLGVDARILLARLELREGVERADRDLRPEEQRLQRGDRCVTAEHGHEPGHAGGEERPAIVARAHAQRGEVGDRAVEGAAQALPPPANAWDAQRPGRNDVARGLALLVELLDRLELLVQPRMDVHAEIPALVRLEPQRVGHRVAVEAAGLREHELRSEVALRIDDRDLAALLVVGRRRGRRQRLRELGVAEREVVQLHGDDVREVRLGLERNREVERLGALVA